MNSNRKDFIVDFFAHIDALDFDWMKKNLTTDCRIEAPGFSGTALADAVAFGQWQAAYRLVELGARTTLWQAAALGLTDRVEAYFEGERPPSPDDVTNAFWCACSGGQQRSAEYLLERGADLNWIGHNGLTPLDTARRSKADEVVEWLRLRGAKSADELS